MKKIKKYMKNILIAITAVIASAVILMLSINIYVKYSVKEKIISADAAIGLNADCILILGAGVYEDGSPSPMLEDRLLQGIDLYNIGVSDRLLVSGDHRSKFYDEVNTMKQYAINNGIPSENIFMDHAGLSTYDSMYRARDIFKAKKVIVVTQGYHLYRALYIADALGIDAYGVASDPRQYVGQEFREVREMAARIKDFFKVIIKPYPTYLGNAIPVSGNGDITND